MPVPPPPPPPPPAPPPPPPPPSAPLPQSPLDPPKCQSAGGGGGRNALLADIQKGTRLRKVTQVNDRSAPVVDKSKASPGDAPTSTGAPLGASAGTVPMGPSLSGLFAAGFPTLRPIAQRDLIGKITVSRSSSSVSLKPTWNPPSADSSSGPEPHRSTELRVSTHRAFASSSSAPPSPSHGSKHPPPFPACSPPPPPPPPQALPCAPPPPPPPPPPAPPSAPPPPPPHHALHERPVNKPPPIPSCPPPPPPSQVTKPTWLPIQHSHHAIVPHPSTPPPPPPPFQPSSAVPGDRSSGCFYPPPVHSEPSRFPNPHASPPVPPPPPPLPASFTPTYPSTLPPPPPKTAPVPSPAMRSLPPSYPCNAPTRRPPAVPRGAGAGRLAPPPAPPARSATTELSTRIPPPPPSSLRNGHLHSLDDFESKFQFHPVEDLPPPDEFKAFPRIYPSKENRVNPKPPGVRTHLR